MFYKDVPYPQIRFHFHCQYSCIVDGIYKNIIELDQRKTCNIGDNICVCVVFVCVGGWGISYQPIPLNHMVYKAQVCTAG